MAQQVCCVRIRGRAMIGCGGNASGWGWGGPELVARRGRRCSSPGYDGELRGDGSRPRRSATSGTRGAALVFSGGSVLLRGKSTMKMGHFLKNFFRSLIPCEIKPKQGSVQLILGACRASAKKGSDSANPQESLLRLPVLIHIYIHHLYVLVSKILSSILNFSAPIHPLYHPLFTLSTVGPLVTLSKYIHV
jgi:hypothetical protein